MWKAFYENNQLLDLPIASMLLFAFTFTVVVIRALKAGKNNPTHDHLSQLPLEDDTPAAPTTLTASPSGGTHV